MSEEEDFSKLSIETRWRHPKWKARQSAFEEYTKHQAKGTSAFQPSTDDLRLCASDANVIALEAGIKAIIAALEALPNGSRDAVAIRQAVARPLAEKGLTAAKPAVKQTAMEALLSLVQAADPAGVVDDVLSLSTTAKAPKAITGAIQTLDCIFKEFGSPVTSPAPVLKVLPSFFGHIDRNVRQAATNLACSICRWVGEPTLIQVLSSIKPVQLNELKASIAKADFTKPPARLTKAQQLAQAQAAIDNAPNAANQTPTDAQSDRGAGGSGVGSQAAAIDPWDLADPVDVLSTIPGDFWSLISSAKWKERHEALSAVVPVLEGATKMSTDAEYGRLVGELQRVAQKDMNQLCATQAIQGLCALALGLRTKFSAYAQNTLEVAVERLKEKKQSVIDVITKLIFSVFSAVIRSQFGPILETVVEIGMKHKTPQIRLESTKCLNYILRESEAPPSPSPPQIQEIGKVAVKLLADTSEPIRAAAANVLAALIKLAGAAKLAPILDGLDDHKKKRVTDAVEQTSVKATGSRPAQPQASQAASQQPQQQHREPQNRQLPGTAKPQASQAQASRPQRVAPTVTRGMGTSATSLGVGAPRGGSSLVNPGMPQQQSPLRTTLRPPPGHNPASPPNRRAPVADTSMGLTSPSPSNKATQRPNRPSLSSTPKIVKRTSTNAEFTPARGVDTFRRRIYSPARPHGDINTAYAADAEDGEEEVDGSSGDVGEIAQIRAELELERSLRLDAEKRLARVQVEKDREILRLQEECSRMKLQIKTQKEEFELWLKNKEQRWSQASISSDDMGNKLSVLSLENEANANGRPSSRPPSRRPPSRVLPISSYQEPPATEVKTGAHRTGNDDWERAVSMTHSLRLRVEQLKQQRQRNMVP